MTTELIVSIVMAALGVGSALVWVWFDRHRKGRPGRWYATLRRLGEAAGLSLTSQEVIAGGVMGLDMGRRVLLVVLFNGPRHQWFTIPLAETTSCMVLTLYQVQPTATTNIYTINESIDQVVLQFHFKNGDPPVAVPFYSARHHSVAELPAQEAKIRGWQHFLSKLLEQSDRA